MSNKLWEITDAALEDELQIAFRDKKIYIADGHHRYTTALHYQRQMEEKNGGPLPPADPANWCHVRTHQRRGHEPARAADPSADRRAGKTGACRAS